jgi:hypothetical protein
LSNLAPAGDLKLAGASFSATLKVSCHIAWRQIFICFRAGCQFGFEFFDSHSQRPDQFFETEENGGDNRKAIGEKRARDAARKRSLGPAKNAQGRHIGNGLSRPLGRVGAPVTARLNECKTHGLPCPERNLRVYLTGGALERDLKRNLLTMLWPGGRTPSRRNTRR